MLVSPRRVKHGSAIDPREREFYCRTLSVLRATGARTLVGGAYAFCHYTGIERHTKDIDIFVGQAEVPRVLNALAEAGYTTELTFPHWLGKAYQDEYYVDVIFSSGNGLVQVDEEWFEHASRGVVLGERVGLVPAEEMIWSKAFVQERERFDGADVAHLLRARAESLDWRRLLRRFGGHWRALFAHLVLFGYIYPSERDRLPSWVMHTLIERLQAALAAPTPTQRICRGTLLSRQQYLPDVQEWGYLDPRSEPDNPMTDAEIAQWTAAILIDGSA